MKHDLDGRIATARRAEWQTDCSLELKRLLARAKLINQHYEKDFDLSFSSMLLAFLVSEDPFSRWFRDYVKGIDIRRLLEERKVSHKILENIASRTILPDQTPASYRLTTSTTIYLETADKYRESLAKGDKTYPLQVHHLMAVYIYEPWVHKTDLIRWGFDRVDWSNAFLLQMCKIYPPEFNFWNASELDFWRRQHFRTFQTEPNLSNSRFLSAHDQDYVRYNRRAVHEAF
jgi:hypothetical protein